MRKLINSLFVFLLPTFLVAQNYTISGYLTDEKSGETLISASIFESNAAKGTVSNVYGFYSITLPAGDLKMLYSYVGYEKQQHNFRLSNDTTINIKLNPQTMLQELVVIGHQSATGVRGAQISAVEVPVSQIKTVPALFGEVDVIKALQLLPGVQAGTEGAAGFYVRGGGPDENLFLLDGVPIYNVNHLGGFFSVFNSDAIKNVTLYKAGFPARFGGRLSSVLDVRMKDGNNKKIKGDVTIGLIASKINLEGPILSDKTTFNISARRTYIDLLAQPIIRLAARSADGTKASGGYYFYDLNAKLSHKFSDKDRLYFSLYMGDDKAYSKITDQKQKHHDNEGKEYVLRSTNVKLNMDWGNRIAALRWNRILSNKIFMNLTTTHTRYRFYTDINTEDKVKDDDSENFYNESYKLGHFSGIYDFSGKLDFDYMLNPSNNIKLGFNYTYHRFLPGVTSAISKSDVESELGNINMRVGNENIYAHETALYAEDNIKIGDWLNANLGLHYSSFWVQKKFYHSLQPRFSACFLLTDKLSLKTGYAYMSQYIHLLSNTNLSLPTDLWVPSTKRISPMNSHQLALGVFYNLLDFCELSIEGYYKNMNNVIDYKDGASFMGAGVDNEKWEDKVNVGRGTSYGLELLAQKTLGKTTGWLAYTWSKSERIFDRPEGKINFGKPYPPKYDRRHDISIVVSHKLSERIDFAATWVYSTGIAGTFPMQNYPAPGYEHRDRYRNNLPYIKHRNNFRYPDYHRLDLGINFHRQKKKGLRTWNISVYNAYCKLNPFLITAEDEKIKRTIIFPIIPSFSYSYKF